MASRKWTGIGLFAAGVGTGAALALLYAPRSGKHTRRRLHNAANRTLNRLGEVGEDVRASVSEWAGETSEVIAAGIASGKETARAGGEHVRQTLGKVRDRMGFGSDAG